MTNRNSARLHLHRLMALALFGVSVVVLVVVLSQSAAAQYHQRDRFGIRGGIWPHRAIEGSLGSRDFASPPEQVDSLEARVSEPASIVPFVELYGLFHLDDRWWLEGSLGWAGRGGIEVGGFGEDQTVLLGQGRIDFFPMFAGIRYIRPLNPDGYPHNVYARAGGSIVFANESADLLQDTVATYGLYSPGTEAAFGFLVGGGGEFYFSKKFGVVFDATYRYTNFRYARNAKFDLSNVWLGVGLIFRTR